VVRKNHPEVAQAVDWLAEFSEARLTGTGACVFARFDSEQAAHQVAARLPAGLEGFVARGMNRSPLMDRLANEAPSG
jgi:4-diphosphocytidyl-2-C-methyl-D-erythritol kinase